MISGKMSFVTLGDFSRQHFGQAHHGMELLKGLGEKKIGGEYTGNTAATIVDPVLIVESEVN